MWGQKTLEAFLVGAKEAFYCCLPGNSILRYEILRYRCRDKRFILWNCLPAVPAYMPRIGHWAPQFPHNGGTNCPQCSRSLTICFFSSFFCEEKMTCMQWSKQTPIPFYVNFMLPKIPLELYETRNFKNGDKRTESWFLGVRFATKFVNMLKRNCAFSAGKEFYSKKRKSIWSLVGISFPATSDFAALCCFRCLTNISNSKNNFRWYRCQ